MSFFKKITKEFEGLGLGGDDKKRDEYPAQRDYPPQQPPYGGGPSHYPPSGGPRPYPDQQYQQHPSHSGYDSPQPATRDGGYGAPPPPPESSRPDPVYSPPSDKPPIPQGWVPQYSHEHRRWYYFEQVTGQSQWEAPGLPPRPPLESDTRGSHSSAPGYGGGYGGGYGAPGQGPYGGYGGEDTKEKKDKGSSGMLLGAAGGLAVGAIGGAVIANALDDSDDEHHHTQQYAAAPAGYASQPTYAPQPTYEQPAYGQPPPGVIPTHDAYGNEIDSSDRESLREARDDYEEALEDAQSSDASSSDLEELQEAREEYEEEYEEAYYDD